MNAAERVIETFKDHFISALCTTDTDFPVQLWDRLTPHAMDTLNLMHTSQLDTKKSAYEALKGPYNWNRPPLAPPGSKAIIYDSPEAIGS